MFINKDKLEKMVEENKKKRIISETMMHELFRQYPKSQDISVKELSLFHVEFLKILDKYINGEYKQETH